MTVTYDNPYVAEDKGTQVVSFTLDNGSLELTVNRSRVRNYGDPIMPDVKDIPPDYLAAITTWISRGLR